LLIKITKPFLIKHEDGYLTIELLHKKTNTKQSYQLDLQGSYQIKNLMGVLNTIDNLKAEGFFD